MARRNPERERVKQLFFRRIRAAERQGFVFENKEQLNRLSTQAMERAYDYGLTRYASGFLLPQDTQGNRVLVDIPTYNVYRVASDINRNVRRRSIPRGEPERDFTPTLTATSISGLRNYITRIRERNTPGYYSNRDQLWIDNFRNRVTNSASATGSQKIIDYFDSLSRTDQINLLYRIRRSNVTIDTIIWYDSKQTLQESELLQLARYLGVEYNPTIEVEIDDEEYTDY